MIYYTIYGFKYIINSKIFEFCKKMENVKGLIKNEFYNNIYIVLRLVVLIIL
jgi:hypothetical protein